MRARAVALLALALTTGLRDAQGQGAQLGPEAAAIREHARRLRAGAHISVIPKSGPEEFGRFSGADDGAFTFYDIDLKADRSFRYDEVRKLKNGYGGYNSAAGRHVDLTKRLIAGIIIVGGLIGLAIFAALAS